MKSKTKQEPKDNGSELQRSFYNVSYLMSLLNGGLSAWAKNFYLNTTKTSLMFVMQVESTNLDDVYLSLVYDDGVKEQVIPAAYVGQQLTKTEQNFCKNLPLYTSKDLTRVPPYEIMMTSRLSTIKDTAGIVHEVAMAFQQIMVDICNTNNGIQAQLANSNGNALLFVRNNVDNITKIEFYLKDINAFISNIGEQRANDIRNSIKTLIAQEKAS